MRNKESKHSKGGVLTVCVLGPQWQRHRSFQPFLRPHQNTKNIKSRAVEKLANQKPCKYSAQSNNKEGAKEAGL